MTNPQLSTAPTDLTTKGEKGGGEKQATAVHIENHSLSRKELPPQPLLFAAQKYVLHILVFTIMWIFGLCILAHSIIYICLFD